MLWLTLGVCVTPAGAQDVTDATQLVDVGVLQIDVGGIWNREHAGRHSVATPATLRFGLSEWFEARISGDGFLAVTDASGSQRGLGDVQLGAKVCLWADPGGLPLIAIVPTINLPAASESKGL